jgi:hypothetical protein
MYMPAAAQVRQVPVLLRMLLHPRPHPRHQIPIPDHNKDQFLRRRKGRTSHHPAAFFHNFRKT